MAKHSRAGTAKSNSPDATYIGKHRSKDDTSEDSRGFSVGRGVAVQPEFNRSNDTGSNR